MAAQDTQASSIAWLSLVLIALAGCHDAPRDDISWAQHALERNGNLQVLSVDPKARAFTVRMKDSGELRIVRVDEVVGSLPSTEPIQRQLPQAPEAAPAVAASAPPPAPEPAPAPAPEASVTPPPPPTPTLAQMSEGPGILKSGPGYVIKAARTDAAGVARTSFSPADLVTRGSAVERRDEPIICQGARFLRIDSRNLEFAGDAISAENGCEIHITNSRIAAHGIGVSAHAANVYIENSSIEGHTGAIAASDGAQVYAEASTIRGVNRGLTAESLHDLGGNVWN